MAASYLYAESLLFNTLLYSPQEVKNAPVNKAIATYFFILFKIIVQIYAFPSKNTTLDMFFNTKKYAKTRLMSTNGGVFKENIYFYIINVIHAYEF